MKKILLSVVAAATALSLWAEPFAIDGINYTIIEGTQNVSVEGLEKGVPTPSQVTVPSTVEYDGVTYTVTEIGICAFYFKSVKELTLPSTVTTLGERCFEGMGVTSLTVPRNVAVIPRGAMANCEKLESVTLPENLTTIGVDAFKDCSALASITVPATVTEFGAAAFLGCTSLTEVDYQGTVLNWMNITFDDINANPVYQAHVLKCKGKNITAINVNPARVERLMPYVFAGCTNLVSVDIIEGIPSIGVSAFEGCTSLESVTLPASLEDIGEWAFRDCMSMKKVSVATVGDFLNIRFGGWYANPLTSGADLYAVQDETYATLVTDIIVPETFTAINDYALDGGKSIVSVILPESVTRIGTCAFRGNSALAVINLPQGLKSIGESAFRDCTALTSVALPESLDEIGSQVFADCTALTDVTLPAALAEVPEYMFLGCTALASVILPESVSEINQGAFQNCTSLAEVNFPAELFRINSNAFLGTALDEVMIQSPKLRIVGEKAFYDCSRLVLVSLPESVTNVGSEAFGWTALVDFNCEAVEAPYAQADMCLPATYRQCTLTVPKGSLDSYRGAAGWSSFSTIVEKGSSAIQSIDVDVDIDTAAGESVARYYNLNGVEVSRCNLVPGVYIRRSGSSVSKVLIK